MRARKSEPFFNVYIKQDRLLYDQFDRSSGDFLLSLSTAPFFFCGFLLIVSRTSQDITQFTFDLQQNSYHRMSLRLPPLYSHLARRSDSRLPGKLANGLTAYVAPTEPVSSRIFFSFLSMSSLSARSCTQYCTLITSSRSRILSRSPSLKLES